MPQNIQDKDLPGRSVFPPSYFPHQSTKECFLILIIWTSLKTCCNFNSDWNIVPRTGIHEYSQEGEQLL